MRLPLAINIPGGAVNRRFAVGGSVPLPGTPSFGGP